MTMQRCVQHYDVLGQPHIHVCRGAHERGCRRSGGQPLCLGICVGVRSVAQPGARQRRCLFERHGVGNGDDPILLEQAIFGKDAGFDPAERVNGIRKSGSAGFPGWGEAGNHPVPGAPTLTVRPDFHDLARTIGQRHDVRSRRRHISARGHEVTIIEGSRAHPHQHLSASRAGNRRFVLGQAFDSSAGKQTVIIA